MKERILGVIGGLGPLATACFMERVVQMTQADRDQDHVDMIVYNFPSIPDRTGYILGSKPENPLPGLIHSARALEGQGVSSIAIPCVTAHYFHREIQRAVSIPVIHAVSRTAELLKATGITRAGIMATDGTIQTRLLAQALEAAGIDSIVPSFQRQRDVMHLIYENVKAEKALEPDRFQAVQRELESRGSQVILLGCTELSVFRRNLPLEGNFLDVLDVMAREAVLHSGKKLKPEFHNLLKGGTYLADQYSGISGSGRCPCAG